MNFNLSKNLKLDTFYELVIQEEHYINASARMTREQNERLLWELNTKKIGFAYPIYRQEILRKTGNI
ncbi:MAG: hypothetical protein ACYCSQ_00195 [bacterium]